MSSIVATTVLIAESDFLDGLKDRHEYADGLAFLDTDTPARPRSHPPAQARGRGRRAQLRDEVARRRADQPHQGRHDAHRVRDPHRRARRCRTPRPRRARGTSRPPPPRWRCPCHRSRRWTSAARAARRATRSSRASRSRSTATPRCSWTCSTVGAQVVSGTLLEAESARAPVVHREGAQPGALQRRRGLVGVRAAEGRSRATAPASSSSTRTRKPCGRFCDTNRRDTEKR